MEEGGGAEGAQRFERLPNARKLGSHKITFGCTNGTEKSMGDIFAKNLDFGKI